MEFMNNEEIKKQAKKILDDFAKELEKVDTEEAKVERDEDRRKEGKGEELDGEFRKIMLNNAQETENDCVKAEKGRWEK